MPAHSGGTRTDAGEAVWGSGATGLMPDYRLAPEDPFPAAYEDGLEVYSWLLAQGFAPAKIVLAGDLAGGH